ncbi:hypothetical protein C8J57DRAFT_964025, partial [Mycena rebaudengoi]
YTAISYSNESAEALFEDDEWPQKNQEPKSRYTNANRRQLSKRLLKLYCSALLAKGEAATKEIYIWLDEFCISDERLPDNDPRVEQQRLAELARMADIYRYATEVVVFCHNETCDHTTLDCVWSRRLWTIAEIYNARNVVIMTVGHREPGARWTARLHNSATAHAFREAMGRSAAKADRWHLY